MASAALASSTTPRNRIDQDQDQEDEDAFFASSCAAARDMTREVPRYSGVEVLELSAQLFAHYRDRTRAAPPTIPPRHPRDSHFSGAYRPASAAASASAARKRKMGAKPIVPRADLWNRTPKSQSRPEPDPETEPEPEPEPMMHTREIVLEPFAPDAEAAEFVRGERLREPREFVPAVHDCGPDAKADPGTARDAFPVSVDDLVYLKTSNGDHDYYTKLPSEEGQELRKRSKITGRASVSGLVATLKPPFDEKAQSQRSAAKCLRVLCEKWGKEETVVRAAIATASAEETREWMRIAGGGFTPEWHITDWRRRAELGTEIHRALELYLNKKQTLEEAKRQQNGAMHDALRKYEELVGRAAAKRAACLEKRRQQIAVQPEDIPTAHDKVFETFTPENVCRTELSLWYEPYDVVGQLDALFWVNRAKRTVILVDWKGVDAGSESDIRAKLRGYEAQLMLYVWLMKNAPAPTPAQLAAGKIDLRTLTVVGMFVVALPPTSRSGTDCALWHEVVYNPLVVQGLLDTRRNELLIALTKRLRHLQTTRASAALVPVPSQASASSASDSGSASTTRKRTREDVGADESGRARLGRKLFG